MAHTKPLLLSRVGEKLSSLKKIKVNKYVINEKYKIFIDTSVEV
jgi:hypothetical protein